jgi:hypothetical protein
VAREANTIRRDARFGHTMFASPSVAPPSGTLKDSAGAPKRFVAPYLAPAVASQASKHIGDVNRGSIGSVAKSSDAFTSSTVSGELMATRADAHDRDDGAYPSVVTFMTHIVPPDGQENADAPLTIPKGTPVYLLPLTSGSEQLASPGDVLNRGGYYLQSNGNQVNLPQSSVASRSREPNRQMHVGFIGGSNPATHAPYTYAFDKFPMTRSDGNRNIIGFGAQQWPQQADRDLMQSLQGVTNVAVFKRILRRGYLAFVAEHTVVKFSRSSQAVHNTSVPVPLAVTIEHMTDVLMSNPQNAGSMPLAGQAVVAGIQEINSKFAVTAQTLDYRDPTAIFVPMRAGVHLVPPIHHKEGAMLSCRVGLSALPYSNLLHFMLN